MKLLYVTDLHGDKDKYERILNLASDNEINHIVNGGDMLPKYCDRHCEQPRFIKEYLRDYFQRLQNRGIIYFTMLGNDDLRVLEPLFTDVCSEFENVCDIARQKATVLGYDFIGLNDILDHPFGCKDWVVTETSYVPQPQLNVVSGLSNEYGYDRIYNWAEYSANHLPYMCDLLNDLPRGVNPDRTIYVMHMPPAGLGLGRLGYQGLDIGSVDIHEFLKEKQPLLSLHGHIHESPDVEKGKWMNHISKTTCIQPGQTEFGDEELIYVEIDLESKKYERKRVLL